MHQKLTKHQIVIVIISIYMYDQAIKKIDFINKNNFIKMQYSQVSSNTPVTNFLVTQLQNFPHQYPEQQQLFNYIQNIDQKLQYAQWKQNLILKYNYMPLTSIKERIQIERTNYLKKMTEQQKRSMALVENTQLLTQLANMKTFKQKLSIKSKQYERFIISRRQLNMELRKQVEKRKKQLKLSIKQNMILSKIQFEKHGVDTKYKLQSYVSQRNLQKRCDSKLSKTRGNSLTSLSINYQSKLSINYQSTSRQNNAKQYSSQKSINITNNTTNIKFHKKDKKANQLFSQCFRTYYKYIQDQTNKQKNDKKLKIQQQLHRKLSDTASKIYQQKSHYNTISQTNFGNNLPSATLTNLNKTIKMPHSLHNQHQQYQKLTLQQFCGKRPQEIIKVLMYHLKDQKQISTNQ